MHLQGYLFSKGFKKLSMEWTCTGVTFTKNQMFDARKVLNNEL